MGWGVAYELMGWGVAYEIILMERARWRYISRIQLLHGKSESASEEKPRTGRKLEPDVCPLKL
jgi:hypothetical protein